MSWHCSRELVVEFLAASCLDGVASALSNTTPMPEAYYWPDKTTEHSRLFRFGMMSEPLTGDLGAELLTWFLAAFPAKTSAQPEKERDLMESEADSGPKWHGSFAKYSHDTHSWKTAQCSLVEDLEKFSETWPKWGSMRNGGVYLRQIPERITGESESGLWPTPTANCGTGAGHQGRDGGFNLQTAVRNWPTPTACMHKRSSEASLTRKDGQSRQNDRLDHAVMASDGGQLNPTWVEWLMGWPLGWTDLKPLETAKFREWQQQHSIYSPMLEAA